MIAGKVALQAIVLSAIFISLCVIVYGTVAIAAAKAASRGGLSDHRRRLAEGVAGGLLIIAAGRLATS